VGFHGILFYDHLGRKTAGWCLFQLGLVYFLWQLVSLGSPLPVVLILLILASTIAVGTLLFVFCVKLGRRFKTLDGKEIGRRHSK